MEDLKIGAVFSLADSDCIDTEQTIKQDDGTLSDPADLLPDADDIDEVDIMPGAALSDHSQSKADIMPVLASHLADNCSHMDSDHGLMDSTLELNESTDSVPSPRLSDLDAPPSLQLEGVTGRTMSPCSSGFYEPIPPTLFRELSPLDQENDMIMESPRKKIKLNQTILPSYIVLSKVDRFVRRDKTVSYRNFKHLQTECSNMCKKTFFKRRLHAGQDVFNVKTPSKQKDYQVYLQQYEEEREKSIIVRKRRQAKARTLTTFTDMLRIHDRNIKNRTKTTNRKYFSRVRRNISRIPTDFRVVHTPDERECLPENESINGRDEKEHKRQLESLKRLIMIKRKMNYKLRQLKLQEAKSQSPLDISGTKSFSGRVRKTNNRYKGDFASSRSEVERFAIISNTKKMLEHEQKKLKQSAVKDRKPQLMPPAGTKKQFVIDIENDAFTNKVHTIPLDGGKQESESNSTQKEYQPYLVKPKVKSMKERLKAKVKRRSNLVAKKGIHSRDLLKETELQIHQTRQELAKKKTKDGVLIQDMPNEGNVLSKILQTMNVPMSRPETVATSHESKLHATDKGETFKFTRELLKGNESPHVPQKEVLHVVKVKQEPIDTSYETPAQIKTPIHTSVTKETLDKYKMLRIPENVQKLFLKSSSVPSVQQLGVNMRPSYAQTKQTVVGAPLVKVITPTSNMVSSSGVNTLHQPQVVRYPCGPLSTSPGMKTAHQSSVTVTSKILHNSKSLLRPTLSSPQSPIQTQAAGTQCRILSRNVVNVIMATDQTVAPTFLSTTNTTSTMNTELATDNPLITRVPVPTTTVINLRPVCQSSPRVVSPNVVNQSVSGGVMPVILTSQLPGQLPEQQIVPKAAPTSVPIRARSTQTQVQSANALKYVNTAVKPVAKPVAQPVQQTTKPPGKFSLLSGPPGVSAEDKLSTQMLTKGKFYLLKVDGKNILIPTDNMQTPTKAFVINAALPSTLPHAVSMGQGNGQMATLSSNTLLSPSTTQMKLPSKPLAKPTATVGPNLQGRPIPSTTAAFVTYSSSSSIQASGGGKYLSVAINQASPSPKPILPSNVRLVKSGDKGIQHSSQIQTVSPATQMTVSDLLVVKRNRIVEDLKRKCAAEMALLNSQKQDAENAKQKETEMSIDELNQHIPDESVDDSYEEKEASNDSTTSPACKEDSDNTIADVTDFRVADQTQFISDREEYPFISAKEQDTSEVEDTPKPAAFSEAVSAREERLRRLKELLKQKQEAVEAIRPGKT